MSTNIIIRRANAVLKLRLFYFTAIPSLPWQTLNQRLSGLNLGVEDREVEKILSEVKGRKEEARVPGREG